MNVFSLALAWNWQHDSDFVAGVEEACTRLGLTTYRIEPSNVAETLHRLRTGEIAFQAFLDRASDDDDSFLPLVRHLAKSSVHFYNLHDHVDKAKDKATMHLEFITNGLYVPYTIIISPYNKKKELELSLSELAKLGRPFIIKPANTTGGGTGVVLGAETLKDIIETRQHHKNDKYLLQETVHPKTLDGNKAWFRVLYVFDEIIPCWWDDVTHIYRPLGISDEERFGLGTLRESARKIQKVCHLDFFSSEIAVTEENAFVVVDYVNEVCDMRLQSKHVDGVPDEVVQKIQRLIANETQKICSSR